MPHIKPKASMAERAHARLDQHERVLRRLEKLVAAAANSAQQAGADVREHIAKCDGRDATNSARYEAIHSRLKGQDKILWMIISVMGTVAVGMAVMAWDIIKTKLGL